METVTETAIEARKRALLESIELCEEFMEKYANARTRYEDGLYDAAIALSAKILALTHRE